MENQVAMCRDYIQKVLQPSCLGENQNAEDTMEIFLYEDEGFSGKNTNRPEFQRMMRDLQTQNYAYLICYRLDRLGRNLIDLANLIEELNRREVSFISVKEQFDTSTPMGKAMLYFAGVLAQMEREQIAERVRDNMRVLARSGRWLGGNTPLGLKSVEKKAQQMDGKVRRTWYLLPDEKEILLVKRIFQLYLEKRSLGKVVKNLQLHQIQTRKNRPYTVTAVRNLLRNPVYCTADAAGFAYFEQLGCQMCLEAKEATGKFGYICYAKTVSGHQENPPEKWILALGKHPGIISGEDFAQVQKQLEQNSRKGTTRPIHNEIALLPGLFYCSCGGVMRPKYYGNRKTEHKNHRRFSYICSRKYQTHQQVCQVPNIQGNWLDEQVCQVLFQYFAKKTEWKEVLKQVNAQLKTFANNPKKWKEDLSGERMDTVIWKQQIAQKEIEIQNLLDSLAKSAASPSFVQEVERQIAEKKAAIFQMQQEYEAFSQKNFNLESAKQELAQALSAYSQLFQTQSVLQQREWMKQMVERIVWDGETVEIYGH